MNAKPVNRLWMLEYDTDLKQAPYLSELAWLMLLCTLRTKLTTLNTCT